MPRFDLKPSDKFSSWLQNAVSDKVFIYFVTAWAVPLILSVILTLYNFNRLPLEIPLFYSRIWGEGQIAARQYIYLPIGGVGLLGIFNIGLAISLHHKDKVVSYLLAGTASLISLLCAITIFNIIELVL